MPAVSAEFVIVAHKLPTALSTKLRQVWFFHIQLDDNFVCLDCACFLLPLNCSSSVVLRDLISFFLPAVGSGRQVAEPRANPCLSIVLRMLVEWCSLRSNGFHWSSRVQSSSESPSAWPADRVDRVSACSPLVHILFSLCFFILLFAVGSVPGDSFFSERPVAVWTLVVGKLLRSLK